MKNCLKKLSFIALALFIASCSKDDDTNTTTEQPADPTVALDNEINDFVWKAMNHWYFWQGDVSSLDDSRDDDLNDYYSYLNGFSDPQNLFNSLTFSADDFSWYIPDLEEQLNAFRGISESYGINLGYVLNDPMGNYFIYVTYTVPGSPADAAGIKRGDLIYKVDGTVLNGDNFQILNRLFTETSINLGIAQIDNGEFTPQTEDIALTAVEISENPVHYWDVIEEGGSKIGYVVYNGFRSTFHSELNAVFGELQSAGINELILDLRYNGGGSVLTSALLASMIDGDRGAFQDLFAELRYNAKRNQDEDRPVLFPFFDEVYLYDKVTGNYLSGQEEVMNRLTGLPRLIVLTTGRTASASEMIINGLRPFMEVVIIGDQTTGKNEGSNTLVDAPGTNADNAWLDDENRNPNHNVALQPITFQIFNANGQSDYSDGFFPDVEALEFRNVESILPFGDPNDYQLRVALDYIQGISARPAATPTYAPEMVGRPKAQPFETEMFILPGELTPLKGE
ncbi:S41 family peptidase [Robertkochia sediminum]|uniref:S41 family peptidase n=1 Tax=Robertkochia sediminum TaxID=2785326 RepID=UPI001933A103|nr:S41 family peptidase [Robertkochia sediminum]MBL7473145.1 PDZ domain-containing protein [Robertkochia sediminum]